jgi:hypothetical protein
MNHHPLLQPATSSANAAPSVHLLLDADGESSELWAASIEQASRSTSCCIIDPGAGTFTVEPGRDASHPIEARAVSAAFLQWFVRRYLDVDSDETTAEVVARVIKPMCSARQCRFARLLLDAGYPLEGHVGNATAFVSHAWKGSFKSLVAALVAQDAADPAGPGDTFTVSLHLSCHSLSSLSCGLLCLKSKSHHPPPTIVSRCLLRCVDALSLPSEASTGLTSSR